MFWNDDEDIIESESNSDVIDIWFSISGNTLPVDYLVALAHSLDQQVSWWRELNDTGFYLQMAGEEGNGWYRESDPDAVMYLSRRNKFVVRTPGEFVEKVESLSGVQLDVQGHKLLFTHKQNKPLKNSATLYSRYLLSQSDNELEFLQWVQQELASLGIRCKKILAGKSRELRHNNQIMNTRSVMLNDLKKEDSLLLQRQGLGEHQKMGCGIFVPHKSITQPG